MVRQEGLGMESFPEVGEAFVMSCLLKDGFPFTVLSAIYL